MKRTQANFLCLCPAAYDEDKITVLMPFEVLVVVLVGFKSIEAM